MRFATTTLGCKVNQCDTRTLHNALVRQGHEHLSLGDGVDLCVVNTCSVTAESVRKSRQTIRRIKKLEPFALIAVCGCYSQLQPDEVGSLGVDFVSGTGDKEKLALEIEQFVGEKYRAGHESPPGAKLGESSAGELMAKKEPQNPKRKKVRAETRTRAFLKIQDGCDHYCAYCVIPYARGASRSEPLERIMAEVEEYKKQGYNELVITGIEISSYGKDVGNTDLLDIINSISLAIPGVRLRIGSLDPSVLSLDFCKRLAEIPQLCNHFHISLQSGCDETLLRMGRKYSARQVLGAIATLRENFTDCAIAADLITGFPGESEKEFEETLGFIKRAAFSDMHIFPFSPRPGTRAADMQAQVGKALSKERARIASEAARQSASDFRKAQIGKVAEVLFEQQKNGCSIGRTTNYIEVAVSGDIKRNTICKIELTGVENSVMTGKFPIIQN